ncbi:MAG: glycosyl transferase, group 2 family [Gammaproteobacteria bacterium]|nr:glycosyl transferase, group 2 family [Gammaproteobacteria bacterium]
MIRATPGAPTRLSIVVPCFNEQDVLPETARRVRALLDLLIESGKICADSQIVLVDDGSQDRTWELIRDQHRQDARVRGLKLSGNRGHQIALVAGLFTAEGDAIVSVDADLQDDLAAIEAMVDEYRNGYDVVYGVRRKRTADTFLKRVSAKSYYRLLALLGVRIVHNHADFRLLSRRAIEALKQYSEVNLFLRGLVPLIGFKSTSVLYDRAERFAGESKYPLRKMLALAADGVTSFTAFPLRVIAVLGVLVSFLSVAMMMWVLWVKLFTTLAIPGWTSSVIPVYFLGGIQLLSIGILGEYVAKLYSEAKRRPRYFVEEWL